MLTAIDIRLLYQ